MRFIAKSAIAGIFAALVLTAASSHAQIVGGSISGVINDASGAAIPGAAVVIRNQETGSERQLTTNGEGLYSAPSIPVGRYSVSAAKDGFATQQRDAIAVTVGDTAASIAAIRAMPASTKPAASITPSYCRARFTP